MSRAIENYHDRERPVPHGEDDMDETKTSETTASIRGHLDRERRVAAVVLESGDRITWAQIMRAASDVEQFTIPIADERDALRAEVERLKASAVWLTYDPDDGWDEHGTEMEGRSALDGSLEWHTDRASEEAHPDVGQVALYRCVRVAGIRVVVTDRAEDQTEGGEECRERGWDYMVALDIDDTEPAP